MKNTFLYASCALGISAGAHNLCFEDPWRAFIRPEDFLHRCRGECLMLGIIGGTSLLFSTLPDLQKESVDTPYGSADLLCGEIVLLMRHQYGWSPHRINFRATSRPWRSPVFGPYWNGVPLHLAMQCFPWDSSGM